MTAGLSACSAAPEPEISGSAEKSEAVTSALADAPPVKTFAEGFVIEAPRFIEVTSNEISDTFPVRFQVSDPSRLSVAVISADKSLLDGAQIELVGDGAERQLRIHAGHRIGSTEVALVAFDGRETARHSLSVVIRSPRSTSTKSDSPTASS
ncbi:MAG: hypothetical protein R3F04_01165 [Lysobacteraceae bacterium]